MSNYTYAHRFKNLFLLIGFLLFSLQLSAYDVAPIDMADAATKAKVEEGEKLFKANCASCHKVDAKLTGPALKDVWTKWESQVKIVSWVQNSSALIASGDAYANKVFNENNKATMTAFPQLTADQISSIIDFYVQAAQNGLVGAKAAAPTATVATANTAESNTGTPWYLWFLFAVLALAAAALYTITNKLDGVVREKTGDTQVDGSIIKSIFSKKTKTFLIIIGILVAFFFIAKGAINIGRSQNYAPEQPIKFSHALHVGQNKIECQFCHYGAEKGRHAVIPSTTVCMNCHKYVQQGPKFGKSEIAKIYKASGWDAEKAAFVNKPQPIKWVKIHNLPDHVYFNHSQHVKVGGIACQTCHGKVEEYEVMKQFAPLSMGWCINCHRHTDVKFQDNNYYSIFEKYHEEIKNNKRDGVSVEDIGGTECSKCHY
jgi:mono/diheme cytochrome c family protein